MGRIALTLGAVCLSMFPWADTTPAQKQEALSHYFGVEHVGGGFFRGAHLDLYVRSPEGRMDYIGSTLESEWMADSRRLGSAGAGLQESVVAVSQDGRSVVFIHQPAVAKRGFKQEGGIYRYEYGKGARLLYKLDDLRRSWTRWPKPIPSNVMVFQLVEAVDPASARRALTAEGEEFPLALLSGTPLHKAAYEGQVEDVSALLEKKEDINARTYWGFTPLDVAIVRGQEQIGLRLLEHKANLTAGEYPSFHLAVNFGRLTLIEAMVKHGLDINAPDPSGWPPLHIAVQPHYFPADVDTVFGGVLMWNPDVPPKSFPQTAIWLLKHGADPNQRNKEGKGPLHLVSETRPIKTWMVQAVRLLVENGADTSARDRQGNTCLHLAASSGCGDERYYGNHPDRWEQSECRAMLELVVSHSSDINARNAAGLTPLQLAVERNSIVTAQFLVAKGADETVRDAQGRTMRERIQQVLRSDWWKTR